MRGIYPGVGWVGKFLPWWVVWRSLRDLWCNLPFCSFLFSFFYCSVSSLLFYLNVTPSVCNLLSPVTLPVSSCLWIFPFLPFHLASSLISLLVLIYLVYRTPSRLLNIDRLFNSCCSFRERPLILDEREFEEEWVAICSCSSAGNFLCLFLGIRLSNSACVNSSKIRMP